MTLSGAVATIRFGYGARAGELAKVSPDPKGWLLGQLSARYRRSEDAALAGLPASNRLVAEWLSARGMKALTSFNQDRGAEIFKREISARMHLAAAGEAPFRERLVRFWSNHFTVSAAARPLRPFVGSFEREAIRPHVTGRFADMLLAVVRHPVMLIYLDNVNSAGAQSRHGKRTGRGLNENLAREILELHTLGVSGGYTQSDVIALAEMLTGWRFADLTRPIPGSFCFEAGTHQPGRKTLLGRIYEEDGVVEGEAALAALARHPATARHLARKLARHFVADDPPVSAIERLERVFIETDGDLAAVAGMLVEMPESWTPPLGKIKTADDLIVSIWRLLGTTEFGAETNAPLEFLGQEPFTAPSPAGWPDTAAAWVGPEATMRRIELAELIGRRHGRRLDAMTLIGDALGPLASPQTVRVIGEASSRQEALALLIASPEFQRR